MPDDVEIIDSPLQRTVTRDGTFVEICIYRGVDTKGWILEIVDEEGGSTVWNDEFETDQAALDEALKTIEIEGIRTFMTEK